MGRCGGMGWDTEEVGWGREEIGRGGVGAMRVWGGVG